MVQGLGLSTFTAKARFQSPVRKLVSHKPHCVTPPPPPTHPTPHHPAAKKRERENETKPHVAFACHVPLVSLSLDQALSLTLSFLAMALLNLGHSLHGMFLGLVLSVASL